MQRLNFDRRPGRKSPRHPRRLARAALAVAVAFLFAAAAPADNPSKLPIPRFVSLKEDRVNVRVGPSLEHNVSWIYVRKGLPVEVIAEHDVWRQIRDRDGSQGWVHARLLDGTRTAMIAGQGLVAILARPKDGARVVAQAEPGVVLKLEKCEDNWCAVAADKIEGWIDRARLWGVYPNETVE